MNMRINDFKEFRFTKCQLKEASRDTSKSPVEFMVGDTREVVDFDKVKENYLRSLDVDIKYASSVDALLQDDSLKMYFVEFKNGDIDADNIKNKAKDSLIIVEDITGMKISEIRDNSEFVLVINNDKFKRIPYDKQRALHLAKRGKIDYAQYGLDKLRGFCYSKVNVMSANDFQTKVAKIKLV